MYTYKKSVRSRQSFVTTSIIKRTKYPDKTQRAYVIWQYNLYNNKFSINQSKKRVKKKTSDNSKLQACNDLWCKETRKTSNQCKINGLEWVLFRVNKGLNTNLPVFWDSFGNLKLSKRTTSSARVLNFLKIKWPWRLQKRSRSHSPLLCTSMHEILST